MRGLGQNYMGDYSSPVNVTGYAVAPAPAYGSPTYETFLQNQLNNSPGVILTTPDATNPYSLQNLFADATTPAPSGAPTWLMPVGILLGLFFLTELVKK